MTTPSHFIVTAALAKRQRKVELPLWAVLVGSVAPDIPIYFLMSGTTLYMWLQGENLSEAHEWMAETLFYTSPYWVIPHNFLHAPLILAVGLVLLWRYRHTQGTVQRWLFWFLVAAALHTLIDILTHNSDGPLLLFPFDWSLRFSSPISYWDPAHFGRQFFIFELSLDLLLVLYLFRAQLQRRWQQFKAIIEG